MPIQHAVLALLAQGPSHGYELKHAFEASVGPQWGALNIGHLYQVLDRLARDQLVTSERVPQPIKPDRVVYEITDAGRAELQRWLVEPTPRTSGYRDDFFLKVMAAARVAVVDDQLRAVLATQRGFLLRELRNLQTLGQDTTDGVVRLLLTAAARHVQADLAFLDDAEEMLVTDRSAGRDDRGAVGMAGQRAGEPVREPGGGPDQAPPAVPA